VDSVLDAAMAEDITPDRKVEVLAFVRRYGDFLVSSNWPAA